MSTFQEVTRSLRAEAVDLGFAAALDSGVAALLDIPADEKLDALDMGARFLFSARGKKTRDRIVADLVAGGFPETSARDEVDMLPYLLSRRYLETIVSNSAALPGGAGLLDGQFIPVAGGASGVTVTGLPVGPVLIIGSGNAFVPALAAATQALLCSCPVALRGSRLNQSVLELVVDALRSGGGPALASLLEHLHLFFVDHRDPTENAQLHELLRTGPFGAGVFWGGREMLDALLPQFALNPRHPLPIPMEPLTGVAVVTQRWLGRSRGAGDEAAQELADAMVTMGQQMCSSPTEGYFVGTREQALAFARDCRGRARALGRGAPAPPVRRAGRAPGSRSRALRGGGRDRAHAAPRRQRLDGRRQRRASRSSPRCRRACAADPRPPRVPRAHRDAVAGRRRRPHRGPACGALPRRDQAGADGPAPVSPRRRAAARHAAAPARRRVSRRAARPRRPPPSVRAVRRAALRLAVHAPDRRG